MQQLNWNDLRYLLAVARGKTLSGAARLLSVDDTTVSRRLAALRRALGDELCHRQADGVFVLTDAGATIVRHAETMEREADFIGEAVGGDRTGCSGTVRVTSVPFLINRWLAPRVSDLLGAFPKLDVELVPGSQDLNLDLREADIALRFARPTVGGSKVVCRRVGSFAFGVFAARRLPAARAAMLPWIGYEDAMAHLPQARWISNRAKQDGSGLSGLRVHDLETAFEAVLAGVGRSVLPIPVAQHDKLLRRLEERGEMLTREVWLLTHRDRQSLSRVRAVAQWIEAVMKSAQAA